MAGRSYLQSQFGRENKIAIPSTHSGRTASNDSSIPSTPVVDHEPSRESHHRGDAPQLPRAILPLLPPIPTRNSPPPICPGQHTPWYSREVSHRSLGCLKVVFLLEFACLSRRAARLKSVGRCLARRWALHDRWQSLRAVVVRQ